MIISILLNFAPPKSSPDGYDDRMGGHYFATLHPTHRRAPLLVAEWPLSRGHEFISLPATSWPEVGVRKKINDQVGDGLVSSKCVAVGTILYEYRGNQHLKCIVLIFLLLSIT